MHPPPPRRRARRGGAERVGEYGGTLTELHVPDRDGRRPGDVHVHHVGACSPSFGDGVALADGDVMIVRFERFGRALRSPPPVDPTVDAPVLIRSLA